MFNEQFPNLLDNLEQIQSFTPSNEHMTFLRCILYVCRKNIYYIVIKALNLFIRFIMVL